MKKILIFSLVWWQLSAHVFAQAVIVPSPIPALTNNCTLKWQTATNDWVCSAASAASQPLTDALGLIADDANATKILAFQLSALTASTTRTWTIPDANITVPSTIASLGANTFTGLQTANGGIAATTGTFSSTLAVTGAVTGGTYNGQTISSAATFTGTVTVAGILAVSGVGIHTFSGGAGASTGNLLDVVNVSTGASAYVGYRMMNSAGEVGTLNGTSTGNTFGGAYSASGVLLRAGQSGGLSLQVEHASATIRFFTVSSLRAQINANGTQTWAPYGAGTATFDASGNITSVSDARYKDRIEPLGYGLPEILQLRPVRHGYNAFSGLERDHLYGGFLAQDVQRVMPLAVGVDARGYLTLSDRPITAALVTAVQQHDAQLTAQSAATIAAEAWLANLESRVLKLEKQK